MDVLVSVEIARADVELEVILEDEFKSVVRRGSRADK